MREKAPRVEERQILSIDSQIKEMLQIAEREGLGDRGDRSARAIRRKRLGQRPVFNEIINDIRSGQVQRHPHVGTGSLKQKRGRPRIARRSHGSEIA